MTNIECSVCWINKSIEYEFVYLECKHHICVNCYRFWHEMVSQTKCRICHQNIFK